MNSYFILELSVHYVAPWYFLNNFKYIGCLYVIICISKKLKQCDTQYLLFEWLWLAFDSQSQK